jgi:catechol 2,3-dioxygenase-like lactoylglutathione lyase family enzyme
MPTVTGLLETSLYVDDLERAAEFYKALFEFKTLVSDDTVHALSVSGNQVLLLFRRGATANPAPTRGGVIPGHTGSGQLHLAFAVHALDLEAWRDVLHKNDVGIESEVDWIAGGHSIYFRDPDRNLVELVTPGTWSIY